MEKTSVFYEIMSGSSSYLSDGTGNYHFPTIEQAKDVAVGFKNNPRSHNPSMSEENVKYWQSKNYTIVKKTVTTEELETI